ncbi:MAG: hypothetical protein LQ351_005439 [Letrouitia transgressa]|nr:MAG: hypothetical protein LQ351_005439 [Letrouitia transgressa]
MAARRLSPTASLLRSSRLFSLPPPLPRPTDDLTASSDFESDTATLRYPTHAAIETTQSSLHRGDWGLKRSLPQRSTSKTSTPNIRVDVIDSIDHITDFDSAADHTLTLRKWQEIGIPLSMPIERSRGFNKTHSSSHRLIPTASVFEASFDNTESRQRTVGQSRWKFEGPWLTGRTDGEFEQYVARQIRRRRLEFREFLRRRLSELVRVSRRRAAQVEGKQHDESAHYISDSRLDQYIQRLRHDEQKLGRLVEEFLDLPTGFGPAANENYVTVDSEKGPPKTHLSAGLSYLRSASHIDNHPVLGPMKDGPPVQARVLRPQKLASRGPKYSRALFGVGGIAVDDYVYTAYSRTAEQGVASFDPDVPGGAKIWMHVSRAKIDPHGRIKLESKRAEKEPIAIYEGEQMPTTPAAPAVTKGLNRIAPQLESGRRAHRSKNQNYGLGEILGPSVRANSRSSKGSDVIGNGNADVFSNLNAPR